MLKDRRAEPAWRNGQTTGRPNTLIASIILFAFCGKITDGCLAWISERALRWQDSYRP
jgi:sulfonate transport system permease protein